MLQELAYKDFIQIEFDHRKRLNFNYSQRAFARDLHLSPARLNEILNGNGELSSNSAMTIAKNLRLSGKEQMIFLSLVDLSNGSSKLKKREAAQYLKTLKEMNHHALDKDTFAMMSEWQYFAVLSCLELDYPEKSLHWISLKLNFAPELVIKTLEVLQKLDLVECSKQGNYFLKEEVRFQTTTDIPNLALRRSHAERINHSLEALNNTPVELRDITSMSMAVSLKKLPQAKQMIKDFRRSLCQFLESGSKEEVYNINIQLVPINTSLNAIGVCNEMYN